MSENESVEGRSTEELDFGMIHPFDGTEVDVMLALAYLIEKRVDNDEQTSD